MSAEPEATTAVDPAEDVDVTLLRTQQRLEDLRGLMELRLRRIAELEETVRGLEASLETVRADTARRLDDAAAQIAGRTAERDQLAADLQTLQATRTFRYTKVARQAYMAVRQLLSRRGRGAQGKG